MRQAQEFREQAVEELEARLRDAHRELFELRNIQKVTRKIDQPHLLWQKKREIARLLTVLREKQLKQEPSE